MELRSTWKVQIEECDWHVAQLTRPIRGEMMDDRCDIKGRVKSRQGQMTITLIFDLLIELCRQSTGMEEHVSNGLYRYRWHTSNTERSHLRFAIP